MGRIEREVASSKGLYLEHWVLPNRAWWFGLQQAREHLRRHQTFRGQVTEEMFAPLRTAAVFNLLYGSMNDETRMLYRSRILAADNLNPVLFELQVAVHLQLNGYELTWLEEVGPDNAPTPEFVAISGDHEIEVECKTQSSDAGRRVTRGKFYQLADRVVQLVRSQGKHGEVQVTIPGRVPTSNAWQEKVIDHLAELLEQDSSQASLQDQTRLYTSLEPDNELPIDFIALVRRENAEKTPYSHSAIHAIDADGSPTNPLIFRLQSASPDRFLSSVFGDLRAADRQFTGKRTSLIACFIPEISAFEGLEEHSAIKNMTALFFEKHARECVCKVLFSSDSIRYSEGHIVSSSSPALAFEGANYDGSLGPCPRLLE